MEVEFLSGSAQVTATVEAELEELTAQLQTATAGYVSELALDGLGTDIFVYCRTETYYGLQCLISTLNVVLENRKQISTIQLRADVKGAFLRIPFGRFQRAQTAREI